MTGATLQALAVVGRAARRRDPARGGLAARQPERRRRLRPVQGARLERAVDAPTRSRAWSPPAPAAATLTRALGYLRGLQHANGSVAYSSTSNQTPGVGDRAGADGLRAHAAADRGGGAGQAKAAGERSRPRSGGSGSPRGPGRQDKQSRGRRRPVRRRGRRRPPGTPRLRPARQPVRRRRPPARRRRLLATPACASTRREMRPARTRAAAPRSGSWRWWWPWPAGSSGCFGAGSFRPSCGRACRVAARPDRSRAIPAPFIVELAAVGTANSTVDA